MVKGRPSCFTNLQWYLNHRFTFVHLTTPNSVIYKISEVLCDAIAVRFPFRWMSYLILLRLRIWELLQICRTTGRSGMQSTGQNLL
jgi:hypothetical protein